jgi:hypothetical protein
MNQAGSSSASKRTLVDSDSDVDYSASPVKVASRKAPTKKRVKVATASAVVDIAPLSQKELEVMDHTELVELVVSCRARSEHWRKARPREEQE